MWRTDDPGNAQPPSEGWMYPSLYSERLENDDAGEDEVDSEDSEDSDD